MRENAHADPSLKGGCLWLEGRGLRLSAAARQPVGARVWVADSFRLDVVHSQSGLSRHKRGAFPGFQEVHPDFRPVEESNFQRTVSPLHQSEGL